MDVGPNTTIEARRGMQSVKLAWSKLAFEYIGAKHPDCARVHAELVKTGNAEWEGFSLSVVKT